MTINDKVAVKAGPGCKKVRGDKTKVRCTTSGTPTELDAWLEDKNDKLTNKANLWVWVDGGKGNDKLYGGKQADVLRGKRVRISSDVEAPVEFDGDFRGHTTELRVEVLPAALLMRCPQP